MCGCLMHAPYWGPGLQPWHMPRWGIQWAIPWLAGQHPNPLGHTSQGRRLNYLTKVTMTPQILWEPATKKVKRVNTIYSLKRLDILLVKTLSSSKIFFPPNDRNNNFKKKTPQKLKEFISGRQFTVTEIVMITSVIPFFWTRVLPPSVQRIKGELTSSVSYAMSVVHLVFSGIGSGASNRPREH